MLIPYLNYMTENVQPEPRSLKCKYTEWNNKPVVSLPVNSLWASVPVAITFQHRPFYEPVKQDIIANGLHFPILVVEAPFSELQIQKRKHSRHMNELPTGYQPHDVIRVVWGGSNRLAIAKELQYEFVDCVLYRSFQDAWADQALQRNPYKQLYTGKRFK